MILRRMDIRHELEALAKICNITRCILGREPHGHISAPIVSSQPIFVEFRTIPGYVSWRAAYRDDFISHRLFQP